MRKVRGWLMRELFGVKYLNLFILENVMQIEIEKITSEKVGVASKKLGVSKKDLIERAILLYLDSISKYIDLKKELQSWDSLSDEALLNFEKVV